jgi:serine/threonine-protein kinase
MAAVYRAWDPRFQRDVAIKVISASGAELASSRARFEREARAVAALEHHAIVPVYDFGEEEGEAYFVMRLMHGGSLADRIKGGPMALDDLVPVVDRVAQALDYAHSRGVIHRDVKPANILFDASGTAFLSDVGIARELDRRP